MISIKIEIKSWKKMLLFFLIIGVIAAGGYWTTRWVIPTQDFEITDDLGGNIFPSAILSTATTDAMIIKPTIKNYLGNPKSGLALKITSPSENCRIQVTVAETPFYRTSVSEFVLPEKGKEYTIYPDIIWNYEKLRNNEQATPINVVMQVSANNQDWGQHIKTFSMRSINECLLGYLGKDNKYHTTYEFFAAYVNEENPLIDEVLREALNTKIVNRFLGYQSKQSSYVDKQVYALWNVLQKRNFRYSSISYSSLSSNIVFSQRVRTFEDALKSSQINCVDGSVLFASLLRAINIDPVLVRVPGHMFVGYYTDKGHKEINFLETTMIGDVDMDEFFPEEKLDSTMVGKSQNEVSRIAFEKSKEYANKKYQSYKELFGTDNKNYMFLEISRNIRKSVQTIGK